MLATRARASAARRSRHIALKTLLDMDAGRLDDLGISVDDVLEAFGRR
jgi:hypothetical protein